MNSPRSDQGFVRMPDAEFEIMLARAAEGGAKRALASTVKTQRSISGIRDHCSTALELVRRTAVQTVVRAVTTAVLLTLLAVIAIKLKIFGDRSSVCRIEQRVSVAGSERVGAASGGIDGRGKGEITM